MARNDVICPINGIRLLFADDEGQYVDIDNNATIPLAHVLLHTSLTREYVQLNRLTTHPPVRTQGFCNDHRVCYSCKNTWEVPCDPSLAGTLNQQTPTVADGVRSRSGFLFI